MVAAFLEVVEQAIEAVDSVPSYVTLDFETFFLGADSLGADQTSGV